MKKVFGILLITLFSLSISTTYAMDYKTTLGIEVPEGDDKKKKKKGETPKVETKACTPQAGKSCCSHGATKPAPAPKKEL
jgi:hypothetical protein